MKLVAATAVGFLVILPALAQQAGPGQEEANSPPGQHALALAPQAPRTPPAPQARARSLAAVQAAEWRLGGPAGRPDAPDHAH